MPNHPKIRDPVQVRQFFVSHFPLSNGKLDLDLALSWLLLGYVIEGKLFNISLLKFTYP